MARRVILFGVNGLPPAALRRFLAAGAAPRFAAWLERAYTVDMEPTLPALTAPGWMCIASGANPSTLGIENILLPRPGATPSDIDNGFDSRLAQAETLWQCLGRQGLDSVVLKYPGSWPPVDGSFVQVDGAGGYADITCQFEEVSSRAYVSSPPEGDESPGEFVFPTGYANNWRVDTGSSHSKTRVIPRAPVGWLNVAPEIEPVFEVVLHQEHTAVPLMGLACRIGGAPHLLLLEGKDLRHVRVKLEIGRWSPFIEGGAGEGAFRYRFKLISMDLEGRSLHLYRSEGHRVRGFTKPEELAGDLLEQVGPPIEWTGTFDIMNGLIDIDTQLEIYRDHTSWMARTLRYLAKDRDWRGLFFHWHVVEYAHHMVGASLTTDHPLHDPATAPRDLAFLHATYDLLDELFAAVEDIADEETLIVLASDHGHDLVHSIFYVNQLLFQRGLLALDESGGQRRIDWARSKAYGLFPGFIYINREGSWSQGIVPPDQVDGLVATISEDLRGLIDPTTGRHAVTHVHDRTELAAYGIEGPRAPDLFFAMDRGYEVATRFSSDAAAALFEVTQPFHEVTSGHGSFHPKSRSARTIAAFSGAGIPAGRTARYPGHVIDIAPTIAAWLGIDPPAQSDGRVLRFS